MRMPVGPGVNGDGEDAMAKKRAHGEGSIFFSDSRKLWIAEIYVDGKKKRKYSKQQQIIKAWLLAQRDSIRDGIYVERDNVTLGAFLDTYVADVAAHTLRPKTLETYNYLIRFHIKPALGHLKLADLRPDHVQRLYSDKLRAGLSRRTTKFIHAVLHKALDQAVRWGLVARNILDLVDAPVVKRKAPTVWNVDQAKKFLEHVKPHRFYPIYVLALATGMREGEVLGVHYEDIQWDMGTLHVRHAVQYLVGRGVVLSEPKTDKAKRTIKVPEFAMQVLREHVERENVNQGFLFTTRNQTPFSPRNVLRHFYEATEEVGLPRIRFHDLRHTTATLLLLQGAHPKKVQELLGHSTIALTMDTYSHVLPAMHDELAQQLDALLAR